MKNNKIFSKKSPRVEYLIL